MDKKAAKRVNIVSLKMVRESSFLYGNRVINSPADAAEMVGPFIEDSPNEFVILVALDTKNRPNLLTTIGVGTLNCCLIHPREIYKLALLANAHSIIIFHNHPSSDTNPSVEDIEITRRLQEAGTLLGVELTDHIILGSGGKYTSLKEKGILS